MSKPIREGSNRRPDGDCADVKTLDSNENSSASQSRNIAGSLAKAQLLKAQDDHGTAHGPLGSSALEQSALRDGDRAATPRDIIIALTYGLEHIRQGAMLVAFEGYPQLLNRAAQAILEKKDGLSLARTGLIAERTADTKLLRKLLQDAITAPELGEPKDSPVTLPRKAAHNALIVRVAPGPGLECWPGTDRTALLTLYDQDTTLEVNPEMLIRLYGLTRGEAGLAARLVQGQSIEDAAAALFISPHTARTHLKRIFMKTDTHRQTELVVRILSAVL